jgi:hypothetical protein
MSDFIEYLPKGFPKNCPKKFTIDNHSNFPKDCPVGCPVVCKMEHFICLSDKIVTNYLNSPKPRPKGAVEGDLNKLRSVLANMNDDVRTELIRREYQDMKDAGHSEIIKVALDGCSTLEKLERHVRAKFQRLVRQDAILRSELIMFAIATFEAFDGEHSSKALSPFVGYLDALAKAAGICPFDAPKAVQDFVNRHI